MKAHKNERDTVFKQYVDPRFIITARNVYERFVSLATYAVDERRKGVSTENMETQMFLHRIMHFWDAFDVHAVM